MSEEVFRWVITAGVGIAALSMVVQAIVLASVARAARKMQEKSEPLIERMRDLGRQG